MAMVDLVNGEDWAVLEIWFDFEFENSEVACLYILDSGASILGTSIANGSRREEMQEIVERDPEAPIIGVIF